MFAADTQAMLPQRALAVYKGMGHDDELETITVLTEDDQVGKMIEMQAYSRSNCRAKPSAIAYDQAAVYTYPIEDRFLLI